MTDDWFRNTSWDESIERAFDERLRRARSKGQYLRIQACTLALSHPEVALKLLDRYFELKVEFDLAQAHVDQATALLALGRVGDALAAYEAALAREAAFPNYRTQASLELPYVVATLGIREKYPRAIELLDLNKPRFAFPVDRFRWHAAKALIAAATGEADGARDQAERALEAAGCDRSGFRHHPTMGLVTPEFAPVVERLKSLCTA